MSTKNMISLSQMKTQLIFHGDTEVSNSTRIQDVYIWFLNSKLDTTTEHWDQVSDGYSLKREPGEQNNDL